MYNIASYVAAIAAGAGVAESEVIVTAVTQHDDGTQTVAFDIILRGARADKHQAVSSSITSSAFAQSIASAAGSDIDPTAIVVQDPTLDVVTPTGGDSDDGDGANVALIAGMASLGAVVLGASVGLTALVVRRKQHQHAAAKSEGIDMGSPPTYQEAAGRSSVKNPTYSEEF
jgi:hypothetical protein